MRKPLRKWYLRMINSICLYLCEVHLMIALKEIRFGNAIDSIIECANSKCNYCSIREAKVRLFLDKDHWLVNKFLKNNLVIE